MSDAPSKAASRRRVSPLILLGGILALGFLARVYANYMIEQRLYSGWRMPDELVVLVPFYLFVVSAAAVALAYLGKRFLNPTSALLLGTLGGGLAAAIDNPFFGMLEGGVLGAVVGWPLMARLGGLALRLVLAMALGAVAMYAAARIIHEWDSVVWLSVVALAAVLPLQVLVLWKRLRKQQQASRLNGKRTLSLAAWWGLTIIAIPLGFWLGVLWDNFDRCEKLRRVSWRPLVVAPAGPDWLWPGPLGVTSVQIFGGDYAPIATSAELNALRGLRSRLTQVFAIKARTDRQLLEALRGSSQLTILHLDTSDVGDDDLALLVEMPALSNLHLANCRVRGPGLAHLTKLRQLSLLDLHGSPVDNESLHVLAEMKNLTSLNLNDTRVSREAFEHILQRPKLNELRINGAALTAADFEQLSQLPNLKILHIAGNNLDEKAAAVLCEYGRLTELHISGGGISDASLAQIATMTNLTALTLEGCQLSDESLRHLVALKNLQSLNLNRTTVSDAGLHHVAGLINLTTLNLDDTKITVEGLQSLQNHKWLATLSIRGVPIEADEIEGLRVLDRMPNLNSIHLRISTFSEEALRAIHSTVRPSLVYLEN